MRLSAIQPGGCTKLPGPSDLNRIPVSAAALVGGIGVLSGAASVALLVFDRGGVSGLIVGVVAFALGLVGWIKGSTRLEKLLGVLATILALATLGAGIVSPEPARQRSDVAVQQPDAADERRGWLMVARAPRAHLHSVAARS